MNNFAQLSAAEGTLFLVRWRGRQEGPFTGVALEARLAAHEIGLLHEIYYEGHWLTIRDYIASRKTAILEDLQTQQQTQRPPTGPKLRVREESPEEERVELPPAETSAEQARKDELLAAELLRPIRPSTTLQVPLQPHRGWLVFLLAVVGFVICGPVCLVAAIMATTDLRQMDAGRMDASGRAQTSLGRNIGILGIFIWLAGTVFFALQH